MCERGFRLTKFGALFAYLLINLEFINQFSEGMTTEKSIFIVWSIWYACNNVMNEWRMLFSSLRGNIHNVSWLFCSSVRSTSHEFGKLMKCAQIFFIRAYLSSPYDVRADSLCIKQQSCSFFTPRSKLNFWSSVIAKLLS